MSVPDPTASPAAADRPPLAAAFGCAGARLTPDEIRFFREADPLALVLFARNCQDSDQIRALIGDFHDAVGRADGPVLIDQEGGRVQRLKPPRWPRFPAAATFGELARRDRAEGLAAARANARAIGDLLIAHHVTVNAMPVLDLALPGASDVIGDRAFGEERDLIADLGRAVREGLEAAGVHPIIKHLPGHGRATVDSHKTLPVVTAGRDLLEATDFAPFRAHADAGWGMTAHIVYTAIDPDRPATLSPTVVGDIIRGTIGFDGVLVSDDLCMQALTGAMGARAAAALAAGCDIALHCSGDLTEMQDVAAAIGPLSAAAMARLTRANARLARAATR